MTITGIPEASQQKLLNLLSQQPRLEAVWLFGSRAMGRQRPGSDIDLCLEGKQLSHDDPWQVDLVLQHELPDDLRQHLQRVGRCLWRRAAGPGSAQQNPSEPA